MVEQYNETTVLVTEDDDGHAELIMSHLKEAGLTNPTMRFRDGQEAWDFLACKGGGPYRDPSVPYLLLLDIRMPRMDGVEVLRRVKNNSELQKIPVVMLTTTDDPREIEACYRLGCSFYITKPIEFGRFSESLKRLGMFIQVVKIV